VHVYTHLSARPSTLLSLSGTVAEKHIDCLSCVCVCVCVGMYVFVCMGGCRWGLIENCIYIYREKGGLTRIFPIDRVGLIRICTAHTDLQHSSYRDVETDLGQFADDELNIPLKPSLCVWVWGCVCVGVSVCVVSG
jgi:hypothetical protein